MSLIRVQNHPPESDENVKSTLEERGRNPPSVNLGVVVNELLRFFNGFECLHDAKKQIVKKCGVKKDCNGYWSFDDIERAWGKTQRMDLKSNKRKHWAYVILLQVIKIKPFCYECNGKPVQSSPIEGGDLAQSCAESSQSGLSEEVGFRLPDDNKKTCGTGQSMTGNTKDRSTQSSAELKKNKKKVKNPATRTVYIRVPFSEMFDKESPSSTKVDPNIISHYKLIDRVPSYTKKVSTEIIRKRKSYIMSYNNETKNADWVYEMLNKSILENKCKEQMSFGKNDYENYNQGHLAAAANHRWCQEAYHDTYLMSNMIPQNKSLNNGMWSTLEQHCRDFVMDESVRNVHVYTGPLYPDKKKKMNDRVKPQPDEIDPLKVKAVPTRFFKVIIVEKKDGTVQVPECYVMPNEAIPGKTELLKTFQVDIDRFDQECLFTFIERDVKFYIPLKKSVKLTGEDGNGELNSIGIDVILTV